MGVIALAAAAGPATVERVKGTLRYEASITKQSYAAGEPIDITLAVTNTGGSPVSITFTSGQRFEFRVRRPRGGDVWFWSHDKAFLQVIQTISLKPGEALSFKEAWDQRDLQGRRVDPGPYEVVAIFMGRAAGGDGQSVQLPPLFFTITGR